MLQTEPPIGKDAVSKEIIAVVGLGYVGLPLAVAFGQKFTTIGYDLSDEKVTNFKNSHDPSRNIPDEHFHTANHLSFTTDSSRLSQADYIIVAVPTPVDIAHQPDLFPLKLASTTVGKHLKRDAIVIYESTVYPGATEEVCIPILERESGLKWMRDFHVGYSPERVNPGDKERTITKVTKVVSADNEATLEKVAALYKLIITAGVHRVSSIKVAEAAKVIENTQRDLNIALMNELALIFDRLNIDTLEVLEAAGTKWNFLPFRPGLVGGHCIGVDPYYLTHKAEMLGYHPEVILAGRRINDSMSAFIAQQTVKQLLRTGNSIRNAKIIVLGLTFKEDCSDLRNSKVINMVSELQDFGCDVSVHDPVADSDEALNEYGIPLHSWDNLPEADAIIAAVSHKEYLNTPQADLLTKLKTGGVFVDVKSSYNASAIESAGYQLWRL